jgi:hypothetical protein
MTPGRLLLAPGSWPGSSCGGSSLPGPMISQGGWTAKAWRSDGQVVPSSWAAALMLPSRSARAKAHSASARSARKRLAASQAGSVGTGQTRPVAWRPGPRPEEPGLVRERCPNAFGTPPNPEQSTAASVASLSSTTPIRVGMRVVASHGLPHAAVPN